MQLERGAVVAGRYRLEQMLGQGGMGTVWAATHTVTRRKVALKLMRGLGAEDPGLRKRFLREARAASLVDHPNVVRIHDVFELEDGTPLMVMELLEGETLRALLEREGVLDVERAARLLLPVVSAVGTAHEHGVVHRDLKPENVLLTDGDVPKVLDFGIAKLHGDEGATMTAAGAVLGTPCYMAPEQGFGEPDVDQRADVWAIGVMLYEVLSGGRPVEGDSLGQVLKRLMDDGIAPLTAVAPDVPSDIAELVGRMLVHERSERMADLMDAARVLSQHTSTRAPEFGPVGARAGEELEEAPAAASVEAIQRADTEGAHTLPAERSESRRAVLIGAMLLAALTVGGWLLWSERSEPPSAALQTPSAALQTQDGARQTPSAAPPEPATSQVPPGREVAVSAAGPSATVGTTPAEKPAGKPGARPGSVASAAASVAASAPREPPSGAPEPSAHPTSKGGLVEEPPF